MSHYRDELSIVAMNREPIPFRDAIKRGIMDGKYFVFVSPTMELSECRFRELREFIPREIIERVNSRRIYLKNDVELIFLTDYLIENGALRGIGKVVWCE